MSHKSNGYLRYVVLFVALLTVVVLWGPTLALANGPVVVAVTGPSTANVGDVVTVSVVVQNSPGVFGGQFNLTFDSSYLEGQDVTPGAALSDTLEGTKSITAGIVSYAVSRRGDVSDLTGDVTLATVELEATGEVSSTLLCPTDVRLGAKGGSTVAVDSTTCLDLSIGESPPQTVVDGVVELEGRETGHWGDTTVTATVGTTETTQTTNDAGMFRFEDIPGGDYSFTAAKPGFLAAVCPSRVITEGEMVTLGAVELLAGDINGDGEVGIEDATAIGLVFGSTGSGLVEDLNDDGQVDIIDVILLAANYGKTIQTWNCQSAVVSQYDLYVRRMDFSTDTPAVGETVQLFIMIATDTYPSGGPYFPASYFRWRKGPAFAWNEEVCPVNTHYASCTKTVEFSYDSAGSYQVEVEADNRAEVVETDETNNTGNWTVTVS
jgi:hypothetical protein